MEELRLATHDDAPGIAAIYAPVVERTAISFEVDPPDAAEIERRIRSVQKSWPCLALADGGILGYAYASEHRARAAYRWSVDVSAYVAEHARRNGIATRLYRALFALLVRQGYYNAFAGVTLPNEPSLGLHRSVGFEAVGIYRNVGYKLGAWHDVSWWQRPLSAPGSRVPEPLPFAVLRADLGSTLPPE